MMWVYAIASARPNTNHLGYSNSYSRLPTPDSRLPTPDSRFPIPDSLFPVPCSLFPVP
ncbi:hypothetical protein [Moorena sp. SIO3H5]|uniref:hypothetical protein n=1 Tax=Moorena sp. SIO3H5 TaxID=2607834 RepID=UPI0013B9BB8A|nr:hypothetical protein [Moorena sp. SIO3H5]NEO72788.1 hypothetical protein [Moorena sp. SIO3H5]